MQALPAVLTHRFLPRVPLPVISVALAAIDRPEAYSEMIHQSLFLFLRGWELETRSEKMHWLLCLFLCDWRQRLAQNGLHTHF